MIYFEKRSYDFGLNLWDISSNFRHMLPWEEPGAQWETTPGTSPLPKVHGGGASQPSFSIGWSFRDSVRTHQSETFSNRSLIFITKRNVFIGRPHPYLLCRHDSLSFCLNFSKLKITSIPIKLINLSLYRSKFQSYLIFRKIGKGGNNNVNRKGLPHLKRFEAGVRYFKT